MKKTGFLLVLMCLIIIAGLGSKSALPILPKSVPVDPSPVEIQIRGVEVAAPNTLVVLEPVGVEDSRSLWNLNYPDGFSEWRSEGGKLFISMPKNPVCFSLFVVPNDQTQPLRNIRYLLKNDSDQPQPDPIPNARFTKSDFLVLVEESATRGAVVAKLVQSKFWQQDLKAAGYNLPLIHDKDSDQGRAFIKAAQTFNTLADVPFLAIMSKDGDFLESFALETVDELKAGLGL